MKLTPDQAGKLAEVIDEHRMTRVLMAAVSGGQEIWLQCYQGTISATLPDAGRNGLHAVLDERRKELERELGRYGIEVTEKNEGG